MPHRLPHWGPICCHFQASPPEHTASESRLVETSLLQISETQLLRAPTHVALMLPKHQRHESTLHKAGTKPSAMLHMHWSPVGDRGLGRNNPKGGKPFFLTGKAAVAALQSKS